MKKTIFIITTLAIVSCGAPSGNKNTSVAVDSTASDTTAVVETPAKVADEEPQINIHSSSSTGNTSANDNDPRSMLHGDYEQGMYDGLMDGANDAVNGESSRYHYKQSGSTYKSAYREGYDQSYAEGVKTMNDVQKETDRLMDEYGLDDYDY